MRTINIHPSFGKHCFVKKLDNDKLVKVFNFKKSDYWRDLSTFMWGDDPVGDEPRMNVRLLDATIIQNLCWLHGLAPRVYEIVRVRVGIDHFWGQVQDDLGGEFVASHEDAFPVYESVKKLGEQYGFKNAKDDVSREDVINGKLVDFNTFHWEDDYLDKLAKTYTQYAKYGKKHYHDLKELGVTGAPRRNEQRVAEMCLDKVDFSGKHVVDLGCAGGWFTRYAKRRGARQVVGLDYIDCVGSDPIIASYLAAFVADQHDNLYYYFDLSKPNASLLDLTGTGDAQIGCREGQVPAELKWDVVLFLSMTYHVGVPDLLASCTKELCVVEDNSKNRDAKEKLDKMFRRVELKGYTTDRGEKYKLPVYYCYR